MSAEDIKRRWHGVARCFPLWRFPYDLFLDMNTWRLIGADITTMMIESKNTRRAALSLDGASAETLEAVARVAEVNVARASDTFRVVFLTYVSIPIAIAAMVSDAAPDVLNEAIATYARALTIMVVGALAFPILYFCGQWRAKQIAWAIELYRAGAVAPTADAGKSRTSR